MGLDNGERMIKKITYKELTLIIGIIVALVILFTVWSKNMVGTESFRPALRPQIETHSALEFTKKTIAQILAFTIR